MVNIEDIKEGSIVLVRGNFGSGPKVRAVVTGVEPNIKNGEAGIDYYPVSNPEDGHWAYINQIDAIIA